MKDKDTEQEFTGAIKKDFENSIHDLDGGVAGRLASIRVRALADRPSSSRAWLQIPVAALLFICLAIASYNFMFPLAPVQSYTPDDIELMTTLDSLDLYNDAEFYEWLEG
jgi:hypothetical protein